MLFKLNQPAHRNQMELEGVPRVSDAFQSGMLPMLNILPLKVVLLIAALGLLVAINPFGRNIIVADQTELTAL